VLADLAKEFERLPAIKKELKQMQKSIPPLTRYSELLLELDSLAQKTGVRITGNTAESASSFIDPNPLPEDPVVPAEGEEEAPAEAPEEPAAPAAEPGADPDSDFISIPFSLSFLCNVSKFAEFMGGILELDRLWLVTEYTLEYKQEEQAYQAKVDGVIYVLIDKAAAAEEKPAEEPAEEQPAPAPSSSPSSSPAPEVAPSPAETPAPVQTPAPSQTPAP